MYKELLDKVTMELIWIKVKQALETYFGDYLVKIQKYSGYSSINVSIYSKTSVLVASIIIEKSVNCKDFQLVIETDASVVTILKPSGKQVFEEICNLSERLKNR